MIPGTLKNQFRAAMKNVEEKMLQEIYQYSGIDG
jgi:hypothetical protein